MKKKEKKKKKNNNNNNNNNGKGLYVGISKKNIAEIVLVTGSTILNIFSLLNCLRIWLKR